MGRADGDRGLGSSPNQFPGLDRFLSPGTSVKSFRGEGCGPVAGEGVATTSRVPWERNRSRMHWKKYVIHGNGRRLALLSKTFD